MPFYASIILSIFITLIYWLEKRNLKAFFLFWYIVFLPTMKLLPEEYIKIPGFRFDTFFGLGFLLLDFIAKPKNSTPLKLILKKVKFAITVFSLQALFLIYDVIKNSVLADPYSVQEENITFFILRHLFFFIMLVKICYYMQDLYFRKVIIVAISCGLILLGITSFLTPFLIKLGISISSRQMGGGLRSAGVFRGHPTIFSGFMSAGFGFAFAFLIINKDKIKKLFFLMVIIGCFLGILNSASRSGVFGILAVILFYIIVEKQSFSTKSIIIFSFIAVGLWALFSFGDFILTRFATTKQQLQGGDNAMSRTATWGGHIYLFINNPQIWLQGLWGHVQVGPYIMASHSMPLKFLVYAGIPFFILFYWTIYSLFRYYFKNRDILNFNLLYPLIGYLIPSLMGDNVDIRYLPIILALALYNPNEMTLSWLVKQHIRNKRLNKPNEVVQN